MGGFLFDRGVFLRGVGGRTALAAVINETASAHADAGDLSKSVPGNR